MSEQQQAETEQPFISHLLELRDRLLRMVVAILVFFIVLVPFANDIYSFIAEPLQQRLHEMNSTMIATQVISPFLAPFKTTLILSVFLAMPVILYQLWGFIAPGLYRHERRMAMPLLVTSVMLFYLGMVFAYYVVFPLIFDFMASTTPEGVSMQTDITSYLDFVLTLFFAFGAAFEVPIATIILVLMGVTTPASLRAKRPYIIVGAFVIGMFLTPPDVISQTLLALPMWILFEIGVFFSVMFTKGRDDEDDADDERDEPETPPRPSAPAAPAEKSPATAQNETVAAKKPLDESDLGQIKDRTIGPTAAWLDKDEKPLRYPEDFVPMTDDEMEAELDRMDEEEAAEETEADEAEEVKTAESASQQPEDDPYDDYDDHSGDGGTDAAKTNVVDVKLTQVMEYRDEGNLQAARGLLYEVLGQGDESQVRVARNILAELDRED
jgi:sec-independent protein translocase protein TatC